MEALSNPSSQSPSTDRALDLLEVLAEHPDGLSLSELVRLTELPQNSVYRISQVLHARGYLHRRESDKRFTLSNRFFDLGRPQVHEKSLVDCALDTMRNLRDETGETVQLMVRSGRKGVVLEQVSGLHPVKVMGEVGMRVPLYSCAPGKTLLAWMTRGELESWFQEETLKKFTATTRSTRRLLMQDLNQIRERGFATDLAEGLEGIHCVAAPILNVHDRPVAALTLMAPKFRLPERELVSLGEVCLRAAEAIRDRILR